MHALPDATRVCLCPALRSNVGRRVAPVGQCPARRDHPFIQTADASRNRHAAAHSCPFQQFRRDPACPEHPVVAIGTLGATDHGTGATDHGTPGDQRVERVRGPPPAGIAAPLCIMTTLAAFGGVETLQADACAADNDGVAVSDRRAADGTGLDESTEIVTGRIRGRRWRRRTCEVAGASGRGVGRSEIVSVPNQPDQTSSNSWIRCHVAIYSTMRSGKGPSRIDRDRDPLSRRNHRQDRNVGISIHLLQYFHHLGPHAFRRHDSLDP